jgi:hypothetical protein
MRPSTGEQRIQHTEADPITNLITWRGLSSSTFFVLSVKAFSLHNTLSSQKAKRAEPASRSKE